MKKGTKTLCHGIAFVGLGIGCYALGYMTYQKAITDTCKRLKADVIIRYNGKAHTIIKGDQ